MNSAHSSTIFASLDFQCQNMIPTCHLHPSMILKKKSRYGRNNEFQILLWGMLTVGPVGCPGGIAP